VSPSVRQPGGRQAAYTARNRAALVSAAQEVLAEFGVDATVEQLVAQAHVSPATIYNYFESKDALLKEALSQIWHDCVLWAYDGKQPGESFGDMIDVCRKLFRVGQSQPLFAKVLRNTLRDPSFVMDAVQGQGEATLRTVAGPAGLLVDDFDKRVRLFSYSVAGIMSAVYVTGEFTAAEADESLAISLSLWNLSPAEAKKLTSRPLTD
jgi:AcrR family transcriptional regulator